MRPRGSALGPRPLSLALLLLLSVTAALAEPADEKTVGRVQALESELQRDLASGSPGGNGNGEGASAQGSFTNQSSAKDEAGPEAGAAAEQGDPGKGSGVDIASNPAGKPRSALTGESSAANVAAAGSQGGGSQAGESQTGGSQSGTEVSNEVVQDNGRASSEPEVLPGQASAASLASGHVQQGHVGSASSPASSPETRADVSTEPVLESGAGGADEALEKRPSQLPHRGDHGHYEFAADGSSGGVAEGTGEGKAAMEQGSGDEAGNSREGSGSAVGSESTAEASSNTAPGESSGGGGGEREGSEASAGEPITTLAEPAAKATTGSEPDTEAETGSVTTAIRESQKVASSDEAPPASSASESPVLRAPATASTPAPALATMEDSEGGAAIEDRKQTVAISGAVPPVTQQEAGAQRAENGALHEAEQQQEQQEQQQQQGSSSEALESTTQEEGRQGGAAATGSASTNDETKEAPLLGAPPPTAYLRGPGLATSGALDRSEASDKEPTGAQEQDSGGAEKQEGGADAGSDPSSVAARSKERKRRERLQKAKAHRDRLEKAKKKKKKKTRIKTKREKLEMLEKRRRGDKKKGGASRDEREEETAAASRPQDSRTFSAVVRRGHRDPRTVIGSQAFFKAVAEMQDLGGPRESVYGERRNASMHRWPLTKNLSRADMALQHLVRIYPNCPDTPACPSFAPCGSFQHPYEICRSHAFHSLPDSSPSPRDACSAPAPPPSPGAGSGEAGEEEVALPNPACLHRPDGWWSDGVPLHVFKLQDMYIDLIGVTFDEKTVVDRHGCVRDNKDLFFEAGTLEVTHVNRAVSLFYNHAVNFFHGLIELMPLFITVSPFLRADPAMPIVMKCAEWLAYLELGEPVVGIRASDLNVICIEHKGILHVSELIQPMFNECGSASPELYFELRRRFYLPPDGLPFFDPDWRLRGQAPLSLEAMEEIPEDWVVVLAHRPAKDRSLSIEGLIRDELVRQFGAPRVVLFDGKLRILEAKALFNRALLYVGVHGAAMSNMIFMPAKTFVWEFRPRSYPNGCYKGLAEVTGLHYHLTWGEGSKETPLVVNATEALADLERISKSMRELIDVEHEPSEQTLSDSVPPSLVGGTD